MNAQELYPLIEPVDAAIVPFLADAGKDDSKKSSVRSHRDRINALITQFSEAMQRQTDSLKEDYKKRIQSEVDEINKIMQS